MNINESDNQNNVIVNKDDVTFYSELPFVPNMNDKNFNDGKNVIKDNTYTNNSNNNITISLTHQKLINNNTNHNYNSVNVTTNVKKIVLHAIQNYFQQRKTMILIIITITMNSAFHVSLYRKRTLIIT